jgi:hypothetical protein
VSAWRTSPDALLSLYPMILGHARNRKRDLEIGYIDNMTGALVAA